MKTQIGHSWKSLTSWWINLVLFKRDAVFALKWDGRDNEKAYHLKTESMSCSLVSAAAPCMDYLGKGRGARAVPSASAVTTTPLDYVRHSSQATLLRRGFFWEEGTYPTSWMPGGVNLMLEKGQGQPLSFCWEGVVVAEPSYKK